MQSVCSFSDKEIDLSADGNKVKYDAVRVSYDGETQKGDRGASEGGCGVL